jgi:ParB-like chromosome segregation protein Spo0J
MLRPNAGVWALNTATGAALEFHPIANCFPLIEGHELDGLVADVRSNGVRQPITLYEGKILDGRNRYRAARFAGVDCPVSQYEGADPVGFAVSHNLRRRHLSEGQRAWVAAKLAILPRGTNQHAQICAPSQVDAAEMLSVSRRAVQSAATVRDRGVAELQERVARGETAPSVAADIARLPEPKQREIVAGGESEIAEAVKQIRLHKMPEPELDGDEGDLTPFERMQWPNILRKIIEQRRRLRLTQEALCDLAGLEEGYVGKLEAWKPRSHPEYNAHARGFGAESMGKVLYVLGMELDVKYVRVPAFVYDYASRLP